MRERPLVPREEPVSYYGRSIVKPPIWKPEIPLYFFSGGMAGAAAALGAAASLSGNRPLARRAWPVAFASVSVSPLLLISDLGKPARFINMLRVFKPTSPMNVGSWLLVANSGAIAAATALNVLVPRRRAGAPELIAGALGPPLSTYTAVLISNSAIPVWSEARRELPLLFAAGSAASAGAAVAALTDPAHAAPARRLAIAGALGEDLATRAMRRRLGDLASVYGEGTAGRLEKAAKAVTAGGAALLGLAGRRRSGAIAGGALLLAGVALKRWSVFKAGFQSAEDPAQTVRTQRQAIAAGDGKGA